MPVNDFLAHNPLEGNRPELTINLHDGSDEQVSIIIVHKDQPEYLNILLQSIAVTSFGNNYEIVVVDNGSGKESQDFLEDIKDEVKVVRRDASERDGYTTDGRMEPGLYWGPAATKGVQAADKNSKYLIFLHCDVAVLNSNWIDMLANVSDANQSGMVGVEFQNYYLQNQRVDFVQEWCLLMTRECWNDIGPFPKELPQIGTSFIMTMRAHMKGHKPQIIKSPICHHYRIFSLDISEFETLTERAVVLIPRLMQQLQTSPV